MKQSETRPRIENEYYKDEAPKASAPAAANPKPTTSKLTPISETPAEQVTNAVKGHRRPRERKDRQSAGIQPVSQIALASYLGQAIINVARASDVL